MSTYYTFPVSQPCRAVQWLLTTHKVPNIETQVVDLMKGETESEWYTAINPFQSVPALKVDDNTVLKDSAAIMLYLVKKNGLKGELPEDPLEEVKVIEALMKNDDMARKVTHHMMVVGLFARMKNPQVSVDEIRKQVEEKEGETKWHLSLLEKQLGKTKFIASNEWTVADYNVASEVSQWESLDSILPESLKLSQFPNVQRYLGEVSKREGYAEFVAPFLGAWKSMGF